ncbi:DUF6058 family natural product biosynthesis protein [Microbulbifer sp. ZKSA002]|uniref:DUF6058 family natural product biosynthesis protein n=1 Tax=Microbulbifer sp. ZKSA002 TaxID=3243388 RepID=UPI0040397BF6
MELLNYLDKHFLTKEQLIQATQISELQLQRYQDEGVMPKPSYKLNIQWDCESFFGAHSEKQAVEYFAKGYTSWIDVIEAKQDFNSIYQCFGDRYMDKIAQLRNLGYESSNPKFSSEISQYIEEEWQHFIEGTYGLCTRSGLPEDIAAKELASTEINALLAQDNLNQKQIHRLNRFVDLLDETGAYFAPHERSISSRQKLIDTPRRKYNLDCSVSKSK